jgi:hypothetical protein
VTNDTTQVLTKRWRDTKQDYMSETSNISGVEMPAGGEICWWDRG